MKQKRYNYICKNTGKECSSLDCPLISEFESSIETNWIMFRVRCNYGEISSKDGHVIKEAK